MAAQLGVLAFKKEQIMKNILVVILLLSVTACATSRGFDRGALRSQIGDQKAVTEEDIQKILDLKPQLPEPYKLAIYFVPPQSNRGRHGLWDWRGEDKDVIMAVANDLKTTGALANVTIVDDEMVEANNNRAIRLAAARTGADAVLVIRGTSDIDRYNNVLGYSYILLVTPLFIPGTEADGLFMVNASMWDVRNQYLYLSAEAEGASHQRKPAVFIEENQLIKAAKTDALMALKKELSARLNKLSAK